MNYEPIKRSQMQGLSTWLKKKQHLGQELPEVTRGETEISRTESHAFRTHPSANREAPTTIVLTV